MTPTTAQDHVKKAALAIADEIGRKINSIHFSEEIKKDVRYPHQATLEYLIQELQKRV